MTNLAKHPADNFEEICLRGELSQTANLGSPVAREENCFGNEIIRLMGTKPTDRAQMKAAQRIEVSLRYMLQHLNQPMKVPVLSAMVGLSQSSFFALFKSATGLTPLDFFIRARMQRAGELLEETSLQIKEVAARLGYDDQFYFSRLFKSVHGVSPREYRFRKEESNDQNFQALPAPAPGTVAYLRSPLPHLTATSETQVSERVLIGIFRPAAPVANVFPARNGESVSHPHQPCSVSSND
jgi:AraC-like DNA-binding protein